MAQENVVALSPHKVARLATELAATGDRLERAAFDLYLPLIDAMEDLDPVVRLLDAGSWMAGQSAAIRRLLNEIVAPVARGATPPPGVELWTEPYDASFDDPVEAGRQAERAYRLFLHDAADPEGSDPDAFLQVIGQWRGNGAFVASLAGACGAARVAALLRLLEDERRGGGAPSPRRRAIEETVGLLGTASAAHAIPFRFEDVERALLAGRERASSELNGGRDPLFLLFAGGSTWDATFLVDAVQRVLLPANREVRDRHVARPTGFDGGDARTMLLTALGRNAAAARRVLGGSPGADLDLLLSSSVDYADGGAALGHLLAAATARPGSTGPGDPGGLARDDGPDGQEDGSGAACSMRALVGWVASHRDLPEGARERLGRLTVPYLGSFREAAANDDLAVADHLPGLSEVERRDFLAYVVARSGPREELRQGELAWAGEQFAALTGPGFSGAGLGTVLGVDHRVSRAVEVAGGDDERAKDDEQARARVVWDSIESLVADRVPVAGLSAAAGVALQQTHRAAFPDVAHLDAWARGADARLARDRGMIETRYLRALWARREQHADLASAPAPPAELLEGDPPQLRRWEDLDPAEVLSLRRWLDDPRVAAATRREVIASWGQG